MLNHLGGPLPNLGAPQPVPSNVADSTTLKPVNRAIFVKPDQPPEKVGELFVPPTSTISCTGRVIASDSPLCKPGDTVVYSRFWPFDFHGLTLVTCSDKDLVGVEPANAAGADDADRARAEGEGMPSPSV